MNKSKILEINQQIEEEVENLQRKLDAIDEAVQKRIQEIRYTQSSHRTTSSRSSISDIKQQGSQSMRRKREAGPLRATQDLIIDHSKPKDFTKSYRNGTSSSIKNQRTSHQTTTNPKSPPSATESPKSSMNSKNINRSKSVSRNNLPQQDTNDNKNKISIVKPKKRRASVRRFMPKITYINE